MWTIIDLLSKQLQQLAELCRRHDLSRAEAVRRAVALLLAEESQTQQEAFGLWKGREVEGVSYQQLQRDEWQA
jgi:Ribbon-helix-helix protein, copG family